ncbi:MAG TPA: glycerophosphodiester phosphodiesterase family protein [Dongiaceae bacterium]|nr:glycerophosphodiester phosphodiesterase family protein [Dongiaceae bacterium]
MRQAKSHRPLVVAHRGDSRNFPENTLEAARGAIALGVDVIELDVHRSADNVAFVIHDRELARTTGRNGRIDSFSAAEIDRLDAGRWRGANHAGAKVPRLAEVVEATGDARLCLEFKDGDYRAPEDAARWLVNQFTRFALHRRAIVNLADAGTAAWVKRRDPDIRIALDFKPGAEATELVASGASLIEVEHRAVTADLVRTCAGAGLAVWAWTANEPADWDRLRAAGVAAILTDDPAGLLRHLAQVL